MRFKVKPKPNIGDRKTVIKFAWFPTRVEDNIIWLEKYKAMYYYKYDSFWNYFYWKKWDKKLLNEN
jgi:hypothetical protein